MTDDLATWLRGALEEQEGWIDDSWSNGMCDAAGFHMTAENMRAELEAKRRILDLHDNDGGGHECPGERDAWGAATVYERNCPTLRTLALPYADREGFREDWRP